MQTDTFVTLENRSTHASHTRMQYLNYYATAPRVENPLYILKPDTFTRVVGRCGRTVHNPIETFIFRRRSQPQDVRNII